MTTTDVRFPFQHLQGYQIKDLFQTLKTPCYVVDETRLKQNAQRLKQVMDDTGCKILLAQKAFSNYDFYPLLKDYLAGTEASGLYEARLGYEEMPDKEVHVFCGAYREEDFTELLDYADHIVFNSIHQLKQFGKLAKEHNKSVGLRINPQCSTQDGHAIYDPCAPGSRLGVTWDVWKQEMDENTLQLLDGLHFHTLCEQNADSLKKTLQAVDEQFSDILYRMKWLNMGGGHHITKDDYDLETLYTCINYAQQKWDVMVYLEPGEAIALNAGYLLTSVLDLVKNKDTNIAILDASAACHMPDVIEMPYTPPLYHAIDMQDDQHKYCYRLAGPTCLSGDVIADYWFSNPLQVGDLLVFGDMAIYTTCKNNTFNGMPLPDIWSWDLEGNFHRLTSFGYDDFKYRLGRF